jgi:hypothetical protein
VTIPAVPLPKDGGVRTPLDVKLKSGWHFDTKLGTFESDAGEKFSPRGELPKGSRIVYKVPNLARADPSRLNEHERDLRRYMQVILPRGESPDKYLQVVRSWSSVEEAHIGPDVSLPQPRP